MPTEPEPIHISTTTDTAPLSALRRSKRVIVDVPLVILGETRDNAIFREETFTLTVNAHGGLVVLENRVALGQKIVLMNPKNWDEREATIASLGQPYAGLATVGFEFDQPAPEFWAIDSPPKDWKSS